MPSLKRGATGGLESCFGAIKQFLGKKMTRILKPELFGDFGEDSPTKKRFGVTKIAVYGRYNLPKPIVHLISGDVE